MTDAVRSAIVASAHALAQQRLAATVEAFERLGALSSGRWRAAARELDQLEDDLDRAFEQLATDVTRHAKKIGVDEAALWSLGNAAALYDAAREDAVEDLDEGSAAARLLSGDVLFGLAIQEDPDNPDQGSTFLFGWGDPLTPAEWSWEATWVAGTDDDEDEELDLAGLEDLRVSTDLLAEICQHLGVQPVEGQEILTEVVEALTRALLLSEADDLDEIDEDAPDNGHL